MDISSKSKSIFIINIPVLLFILWAFIGGIFFRFRNEIWSWSEMSGVKWYYNIYALFIIMLALFVSVGLIKGKKWGRAFAITLYGICIFIFTLLKIIGIIYVYIIEGNRNPYLKYKNFFFTWEFYPDYALSALCLLMIVYLSRKDIKCLFN